MSHRDMMIAFNRAAVRMRSVNRDAWDEFLGLLRQRADYVTDQCIASTTSDLLRLNQGRAQEARSLLETLEASPEQVEAMLNKEREDEHRRRIAAAQSRP